MSTDNTTYQPDWQPKGAGSEYAGFVMRGVDDTGAPTAANVQPARRNLSIDDYVAPAATDAQRRDAEARAREIIAEAHKKALDKVAPKK